MSNINMYQYNAFYKENRRAIQNFIFKMTHDLMTAEELVNDVFMKAYQNLTKFDETKSSFKTWVYNIASNATIDYLRKRKLATKSMHDTYPDKDGEINAMDFESVDADPLEQIIQAESIENLEKKIGLLTKKRKEIVSLFAQGFNYEEIASTLGMPIGTVKGDMHIARNQMNEIFKRQPVAA